MEPAAGARFDLRALRRTLGGVPIRAVRRLPTDRRHNAKIDPSALRSLLARHPQL